MYDSRVLTAAKTLPGSWECRVNVVPNDLEDCFRVWLGNVTSYNKVVFFSLPEYVYGRQLDDRYSSYDISASLDVSQEWEAAMRFHV